MIHELIDPKKKTKRTKSSRNSKSITPTKFALEETSVEESENSNKDSSSNVFISPWLRNSFGGNKKNKLSRRTAASPTDLKPIKITLGNSYQGEVDSFKANVEDGFYTKAPAHYELFTQGHAHELRCSQESEEVRVFDFCADDACPISGETSRRKCPSAEERPTKKENLALPPSNTVNGDLAKNLKTARQKNKPRRRLPVTSRPNDIPQNDTEMAPLLLKMRARKALNSYMRAANRSASSDGKLLFNEIQPMVQEDKNEKPSEEKITPKTDGTNQIIVENPDGVGEGEKVVCEEVEGEKELPQKNEQETKELLQEDDKCVKETIEEDEKPNEVPQKIETPKEPPKTTEEDTEKLNRDKEEEEEETKCLEEVKKFLERKKRTRQTKNRLPEETSPPTGPPKLEEVPKEKLQLYRVKGSNIVPCSENVVGKAVDEALQKFVDIYHFHVSHGVMESMKKDIMRALTSESATTSCSKLSNDEKDISNFAELEEKDIEILKQDNLIQKEHHSGDINLCKEIMKKYSSSTSLRKEFETFLNFIRSHIDVSKLKVRNIILEEKDKKDSSERLQFVCNFAKKEVLRVRQHKQEETQTAEAVHHKKHTKQVSESKDATCDKNLQTIVHEQTQTIPEPVTIKKSVKLQVFESKSITCEKSQETEKTSYYVKATQTEQQGSTISEIESLKRCNIKPGLYRLIKSKEAGKFFLYQEHNEDSQEMLRGNSEGSVVKDKKYSTELRSQPSKERTRERNVFFEGKEKLKKKKKNKQKKKKEDGRKDSIDYLYFRNFDKRGSESSTSRKEEGMSDGKIPGRGDHRVQEDQSGCCWLWDGERISPGSDLKNQVENLVVEKLTQMCNIWYNSNDMPLNTTNPPKDGEETLHRTISERTFDVASFKDIEDQSPTHMEEKWTSKKEENNEGEDLIYYGQEDSMKSVETSNVDWKFVSQYLPKLRNFGKKSGSRKKHSRRNSIPRSTSQKLDRLREAEELLLAVEKLKEMNTKKENLSDGDATQNNSTSTSINKTSATVEVPILPIISSETQLFPKSESQRRWDMTIALAGRETVPEHLYFLNVAKNQENEPVVDRRKQMEMIGNVFSGIKRQEKENLWRDIRKFIKKKIGKDINSSDNPGEVCIEIEQEIPESREGINPSIMGNNDSTQFDGEFEVEVDLTLEDLERILSHRRKKMKRRSSYKNRNIKSSSSTHSDHMENLHRYQRYLKKV